MVHLKFLKLLNILNLKIKNLNKEKKLMILKIYYTSKKNDITFFHSKKYKDIAKKTKASFCITTEI